MSIMNYHDELLVQFTRGAELVNRPGVSPARSPVHPCSSQRPRRLFARTIDSMTLEKWERITNIPLFILSAVFLFAYSWQILAQTHLQGCFIAINTVWVVYGVDYVVELFLAPNKWLWFRKNILLLLTLALPIFRPLRMLRLIPMLHIFNRSAGAMTRGRITLYATSAILMLIYVGALAEYSAEHLAPNATITTFPLSLWWAFVTVTTVGYGDVYPVTDTGKIVAVGLMLTGIALIGIVSAMISSWIIDQVNVTKKPDGAGSASSSSYNDAEMRLMRAEMLRLADSVGQLNAELKRTHRITTKKHPVRETTHHDGLSPVRSALVDELDPSLDAPTPPQGSPAPPATGAAAHTPTGQDQ